MELENLKKELLAELGNLKKEIEYVKEVVEDLKSLPKELPSLVTITEASRLFGVTPNTIINYANKKILTFSFAQGRRKVTKASILSATGDGKLSPKFKFK